MFSLDVIFISEDIKKRIYTIYIHVPVQNVEDRSYFEVACILDAALRLMACVHRTFWQSRYSNCFSFIEFGLFYYGKIGIFMVLLYTDFIYKAQTINC